MKTNFPEDLRLVPCEIPPLEDDDEIDCNLISGKEYAIKNAILRGAKEDISKVLEYYRCLGKVVVHRTEHSGICEIQFGEILHYTILQDANFSISLLQIIQKFPALKVVAFLENWETSYVHVIYSESGYDHITAVEERVSGFDTHSERNWHWEISPTEDYTGELVDLKTGMNVLVYYEFPFGERWFDANYYTIRDGAAYRVVVESGEETDIPWDSPELWALKIDPDYISAAYIVQYLGDATEVHFPTEVNGYKILGIWDRPKYVPDNYKKIRRIVFPENTVYPEYQMIGKNAFRGCTELQEVCNLGNICKIGDYAFAECTSINNLCLSYHVSEIGNYAFAGCSSLQELTFFSWIYQIGEYSFADCTCLHSIFILQPQRSLWNKNVFSNCTSLKEVWFLDPDNVPLIQNVVCDYQDCIVYGPEKCMKHLGHDHFQCLTADTVLQIFKQSGWPLEATGETRELYKNVPNVGEWLTYHSNVMHRSNGAKFTSSLYHCGRNRPDRFDLTHIAELFDIHFSEFNFGRDCHYCRYELFPKGYYSELPTPKIKQIQYNDAKKQQFAGLMFVLDNEVRLEVEQLILKRGGEIKPYVVMKADYLIINPKVTGETSNKKRARELCEKGKSKVKIITVQQFFDMIIV